MAMPRKLIGKIVSRSPLGKTTVGKRIIAHEKYKSKIQKDLVSGVVEESPLSQTIVGQNIMQTNQPYRKVGQFSSSNIVDQLRRNRGYMSNAPIYGGQTFSQLKHQEPALYMNITREGYWEPKVDTRRWFNESYSRLSTTERLGLIGSSTVLNVFDYDYWLAENKGKYAINKFYESSRAIKTGSNIAWEWFKPQLPAYENVILPLAGGYAFGKLGTGIKLAGGFSKASTFTKIGYGGLIGGSTVMMGKSTIDIGGSFYSGKTMEGIKGLAGLGGSLIIGGFGYKAGKISGMKSYQRTGYVFPKAEPFTENMITTGANIFNKYKPSFINRITKAPRNYISKYADVRMYRGYGLPSPKQTLFSPFYKVKSKVSDFLNIQSGKKYGKASDLSTFNKNYNIERIEGISIKPLTSKRPYLDIFTGRKYKNQAVTSLEQLRRLNSERFETYEWEYYNYLGEGRVPKYPDIDFGGPSAFSHPKLASDTFIITNKTVKSSSTPLKFFSGMKNYGLPDVEMNTRNLGLKGIWRQGISVKKAKYDMMYDTFEDLSQPPVTKLRKIDIADYGRKDFSHLSVGKKWTIITPSISANISKNFSRNISLNNFLRIKLGSKYFVGSRNLISSATRTNLKTDQILDYNFKQTFINITIPKYDYKYNIDAISKPIYVPPVYEMLPPEYPPKLRGYGFGLPSGPSLRLGGGGRGYGYANSLFTKYKFREFKIPSIWEIFK